MSPAHLLRLSWQQGVIAPGGDGVDTSSHVHPSGRNWVGLVLLGQVSVHAAWPRGLIPVLFHMVQNQLDRFTDRGIGCCANQDPMHPQCPRKDLVILGPGRGPALPVSSLQGPTGSITSCSSALFYFLRSLGNSQERYSDFITNHQ